MSDIDDEVATSANTVTVMVGSSSETAQELSSGVIPSLLEDGDVGSNFLDGVLESETVAGTYGDNLVNELASAWTGGGPGTQGIVKFQDVSSGYVSLTNDTSDVISIAATGAQFYAQDGAAYVDIEDPTNAAWTNGTSQTGSGKYVLAPNQTISIPIEGDFVGNDADSDAAGSITRSGVAGLEVEQSAPLDPGGAYVVASVAVTNGGHYYMVGNAYTPSVTFSASSGASASGYVSELYVAGGGGLGAAGSGYQVQRSVPVEDSSGDIVETVNITSINGSGAITGLTVNGSASLLSTVPAGLMIVQTGASGGTITGTNFGVNTVTIVNPGSGYTQPPTVTFSSAGSAPAATGTTVAQEVTTDPWLSSGPDDYSYVVSGQGLAPAEAYVQVGNIAAWTVADLQSWETYVTLARSLGILNVAPLETTALALEDPSQPFSTSTYFSNFRAAALFGGGLEVELPSFSATSLAGYQWETIAEQFRWTASLGLRSTLMITDQGSASGGPDSSFANDVALILQQLQSETALPSQVDIENDNPTGQGASYDPNVSDTNSLNAVALQVATTYQLSPTPSEDGLEVQGTSKAQTTLIMTGVQTIQQDAIGQAINPFMTVQVFSEDPSKQLTLQVTDASSTFDLSDSLNGATSVMGGSLTFSGTAAAATAFLHDLSATAETATAAAAPLQLALTDFEGQTTAASVSVNLNYIAPVFTSLSATAPSAVNNVVKSGDTVEFALATSSPINVAGAPELLLTNGGYADYVGEDNNSNLLFDYTVQQGDDTSALRVRGLFLDGSSLTDSSGHSLDADSLDAVETAVTNPLIVNTQEDAITAIEEQGSAPGVLTSGEGVSFLLSATSPIVSVQGTPLLELNDGGIAYYAGLTATGQMEFGYEVPQGATFDGLTPTSLVLNGSSVTNSLGEDVEAPSNLPMASTTVDYQTSALVQSSDTLVIALSADEYLGDAIAQISVDGKVVGSPIDVAAVQSAGESQLVTITGQFPSGLGNIGVSFLNDAWAGTPSTDRNLYVDSVTLDGVTELSNVELNETSTVFTPIMPSAQEELQVWVAEDASQGNTMFSIAVDGNTLSSTFSTNVQSSSGNWQEIDAYGDFGVGVHDVSITNLSSNPSGGSDDGLLVKQVSLGGVDVQAPSVELDAPGSSTQITVPAPTADTLTLMVSEDAWEGDALCYVTIDGRIMSSPTAVTAAHAQGATQAISIQATGLGSGSHTIGLSFINDAWGGSPSQDRNLYLDSVQLNGVDQGVRPIELATFGTAFFHIGGSSGDMPTISNITSLAMGQAASIALGPSPISHTLPSATPIGSSLDVALGPVVNAATLTS